MRFVESAPAPLRARPPRMATRRQRKRRSMMALIVAASVAIRTIAPTVEVTPVTAFAMNASTRVPISLWASDTPIENATAPAPATEAAIETAPANAVIVEVSSAVTETWWALIPVAAMPAVWSPSIAAWTRVAMRLSTETSGAARREAEAGRRADGDGTREDQGTDLLARDRADIRSPPALMRRALDEGTNLGACRGAVRLPADEVASRWRHRSKRQHRRTRRHRSRPKRRRRSP